MRAAVVASVVLLGCAKPSLDPSSYEVVELDRSVYEEVDGRLTLIEFATTLPCRVGATFGVRTEVRLSKKRAGRLEVLLRHTGPSRRDAKKRYTQTKTLSYDVTELVNAIHFNLVQTFKQESELIDGIYDFELVEPSSGAIYHSHRFVLANCKAGVALTAPPRAAARRG